MGSWPEFFSALTSAAVALLALLFVSFQIAHSRWISKPARQIIAIQTSFEFVTPFLFGLVSLLPISAIHLGEVQLEIWQIAGVLLSLVGISIASVFLVYSNKHRESLDKFLRSQFKLQWFAIFIDYIPIMIFSLAGNLALTSIMMVWMIVSGSIETWLFFSERSS